MEPKDFLDTKTNKIDMYDFLYTEEKNNKECNQEKKCYT
jgi:hypothetical protein